ncbi:MAG: D-amino-acid transaminase [Rhodospirillales bacterium]|nr:D-amino-acid transaminase [Rhodospirillales bacterium]MDH3913353.1 D-amino-acid transaminase [Rhodospirillales bacterium]MDH3919004.1 D-amino-acid transaminase [Rhodospirillales bacterium]MDH3968088.1 D-amino-acid transaminase [Rhodospirillales bacterium]
MPRQAFVNGRYVSHGAAAVHIEDRGYQFADGVYEVVPVVQGALIDEDPHLDRLERSLGELQIAMPMTRQALKLVSRELMRRNRLSRGFLYMQITRGVAPRDHKFPEGVEPALVMTTRQMKPQSHQAVTEGVGVISIPDLRWSRCDIKSVSLLPNVLGKQEAVEAGAYEAWMVDPQGRVTEGTSTNAWIVTQDNELVTRDVSTSILNGITRLRLLDLIRQDGITFSERAFSIEEARQAREAFITSSSNFVMPVTSIDGRAVGNGHPGLLTGKLREAYLGFVERQEERA